LAGLMIVRLVRREAEPEIINKGALPFLRGMVFKRKNVQ